MSSKNGRSDGADNKESPLRITRREFVAAGAATGALVATGLGFSETGATLPAGLAVAHGPDAATNTLAVMDALGGMDAFVAKGQVVHILPNAQGTHPGTSTDLAVVRTVADLCRQAGAADVRWFTWIYGNYWERSHIGEFVEQSGAELLRIDHEAPSLWRTLDVPRGVTLKTVRVCEALWECDVFISMPIFKHHIGSNFSGSLKNYMGASHPEDNRAFHPTWESDDVVRMEQCVADLNTVVRPADLIVADAMTILTSKGPFGPGDIARPQQVIAGTDRVAMDAYGATLLGLEGPKVMMIQKAHEHGVGEIDLGAVGVRRIETA
jgi:uncharacterized protein (DUF362 family)